MRNIFNLIAVGLILTSCNKEINITQPTILVKTEILKVAQAIQLSVSEYAEIDGSRKEPNYFKWSILNSKEEILYSDFKNSSAIEWTPDSAGYYIISVKIGYDNDKSITTLKEVVITESPQSMQKKLVGKWTGDAEAMFGLRWKIDITFEENGHYIASARDLSDPQYTPSAFYNGNKVIDNPNGGQMGVSPCPDIPCQSFVINQVTENKGFGVLTIGYEYEYGGVPYSYSCAENYKIKNMEFSNGGKKVSFSLIDFGVDSYEWYLRYNLTRVD